MTILVIFFSFNRINGIKINREKALHKVANTKNRINCFSLFWIKQLKDNNTKNNPTISICDTIHTDVMMKDDEQERTEITNVVLSDNFR